MGEHERPTLHSNLTQQPLLFCILRTVDIHIHALYPYTVHYRRTWCDYIVPAASRVYLTRTDGFIVR